MLRALALSLLLGISAAVLAETPQRLAGLQAAARITIDGEGISHVRANSEHDLYFMQGWVHAGDRLFQMDYNRRLASGTLMELVGTAALANDVQLRTLGLRRGAQRSLDAASPRFRAALEAYAEGVNARLEAQTSLPPEYGALRLPQVASWTPVDSLVIAKLLAFSLAFELDIARTVALQSYIAALGPDHPERGIALFSQDLWRSAGVEPKATVPDARIAAAHAAARNNEQRGMERAHEAVHGEDHVKLMRDCLERVRDIPVFRGILNAEARGSSNVWAVSGSLTADGRPLLANDPHLALPTPATFYPIGLELQGEPVFGSSVAGTPGVIHGYNRWIAWGTTNNLVDVTDTFAEQVVPDSAGRLFTVYQGRLEPLIPIPETFRANIGGMLVVIPAGGSIPAATLVVPRRDGGPIISLNSATGAALSVQYVGFGPTQELEAFLLINRARNLDDFKDALQRMDVAQNFVYVDVQGNIAYFTSGEIPVREDLQAGTVNGVPPWVVRDGEVFTPYIVRAFERALSDSAADAQLRALASDAGVAEAVGRLRGWNGSTPTGLAQGYDAGDAPGALQTPSASEVQASIAASIYAAWRSSVLSSVINGTLAGLPAPDDTDSLAALRNLLDNFAANGGIGASRVNFFAVAGIDSAADRRDFVILRSLRAGLDLLATPDFFGSANENDYRWGRLHRVVFAHPLGSVFSIPPAGGAFPAPLGVPGIPTDGGFQTVDASTHNARGQTPDDFMFHDGPAHRTVVEARAGAMRAESIWPGRTSGVLCSPHYFQFLARWLKNESIRLSLGRVEGQRHASVTERFVPVSE